MVVGGIQMGGGIGLDAGGDWWRQWWWTAMFVIEAPAATKFGGGLVVMARSCWVFYLFNLGS